MGIYHNKKTRKLWLLASAPPLTPFSEGSVSQRLKRIVAEKRIATLQSSV